MRFLFFVAHAADMGIATIYAIRGIVWSHLSTLNRVRERRSINHSTVVVVDPGLHSRRAKRLEQGLLSFEKADW